jgi:hypothetical protein
MKGWGEPLRQERCPSTTDDAAPLSAPPRSHCTGHAPTLQALSRPTAKPQPTPEEIEAAKDELVKEAVDKIVEAVGVGGSNWSVAWESPSMGPCWGLDALLDFVRGQAPFWRWHGSRHG